MDYTFNSADHEYPLDWNQYTAGHCNLKCISQAEQYPLT